MSGFVGLHVWGEGQGMRLHGALGPDGKGLRMPCWGFKLDPVGGGVPTPVYMAESLRTL